jgi:hypothetical protein
VDALAPHCGRASSAGARSPSLDGDLNPVTGVERVGLACAWGARKTCVFWGTQLGTLIRKFYVTVRLDYALAS